MSVYGQDNDNVAVDITSPQGSANKSEVNDPMTDEEQKIYDKLNPRQQYQYVHQWYLPGQIKKCRQERKELKNNNHHKQFANDPIVRAIRKARVKKFWGLYGEKLMKMCDPICQRVRSLKKLALSMESSLNNVNTSSDIYIKTMRTSTGVFKSFSDYVHSNYYFKQNHHVPWEIIERDFVETFVYRRKIYLDYLKKDIKNKRDRCIKMWKDSAMIVLFNLNHIIQKIHTVLSRDDDIENFLSNGIICKIGYLSSFFKMIDELMDYDKNSESKRSDIIVNCPTLFNDSDEDRVKNSIILINELYESLKRKVLKIDKNIMNQLVDFVYGRCEFLQMSLFSDAHLATATNRDRDSDIINENINIDNDSISLPYPYRGGNKCKVIRIPTVWSTLYSHYTLYLEDKLSLGTVVRRLAPTYCPNQNNNTKVYLQYVDENGQDKKHEACAYFKEHLPLLIRACLIWKQ